MDFLNFKRTTLYNLLKEIEFKYERGGNKVINEQDDVIVFQSSMFIF